jgi:glutaredoxin-dependent peroxiredoxin
MVNQGEKAPTFSLFDADKKPRPLPELTKTNPVTVLAFFPGAFTSVCTREMCTFRDSLSELSKVPAQVVAISVNDPWTNKAFADHNKLNFPILSDYNREVVRQYNVFHENFGGLKGYTVAKRSIFVLDSNGVVTYKWITEDPSKEPIYEDVKRAAAKTA